MKLITLKALFLACITSSFLPAIAQDDIFSSPAKPERSGSHSYPTSAALLAATKSGEIPEVLLDRYASKKQDAVGASVIEVLQHDYGVAPQKRKWQISSLCGLLLQNLTKYEVEEHDKQAANAFQSNRKVLAEDTKDKPKFVQAFDAFAKDYARAVREYVALKKENEEKRVAGDAQKDREANAMEEKANEEREAKKAVANAQAASQKAEEETNLRRQRTHAMHRQKLVSRS